MLHIFTPGLGVNCAPCGKYNCSIILLLCIISIKVISSMLCLYPTIAKVAYGPFLHPSLQFPLDNHKHKYIYHRVDERELCLSLHVIEVSDFTPNHLTAPEFFKPNLLYCLVVASLDFLFQTSLKLRGDVVDS